jgi:hypothetical protein
MQSITSSKFQSKARTLTFGLEKDAKLILEINKNNISTFCNLCESFLSSNIDVDAFYRVGVCRACENDFAEPNLTLWKEGWRPTGEQVILKKDERNSLLFARYVDAESKIC